MTHTYDTLPPPPDGFGPWHAWDANESPPEGTHDHDDVHIILRDNDFNYGEVCYFNWSDCGGGTITFFCLREDHPFNHTIPEPSSPALDTAGMDEFSLWGTF